MTRIDSKALQKKFNKGRSKRVFTEALQDSWGAGKFIRGMADTMGEFSGFLTESISHNGKGAQPNPFFDLHTNGTSFPPDGWEVKEGTWAGTSIVDNSMRTVDDPLGMGTSRRTVQFKPTAADQTLISKDFIPAGPNTSYRIAVKVNFTTAFASSINLFVRVYGFGTDKVERQTKVLFDGTLDTLVGNVISRSAGGIGRSTYEFSKVISPGVASDVILPAVPPDTGSSQAAKFLKIEVGSKTGGAGTLEVDYVSVTPVEPSLYATLSGNVNFVTVSGTPAVIPFDLPTPPGAGSFGFIQETPHDTHLAFQMIGAAPNSYHIFYDGLYDMTASIVFRNIGANDDVETEIYDADSGTVLVRSHWQVVTHNEEQTHNINVPSFPLTAGMDIQVRKIITGDGFHTALANGSIFSLTRNA